MKVNLWNHDILIEPEEMELRMGSVCCCEAPIVVEEISARATLCIDLTDEAPMFTCKVTSIKLGVSDRGPGALTGHCVECGKEVALGLASDKPKRVWETP